jgi:tRNA-Thr(GGU) m(6)t(6)A37 methyltransferase TsaA
MRGKDAPGGLSPPSIVAAKAITMKNCLTYIGRIKTPYGTLQACPRNIVREGPLCELQVDEEFARGLIGLAPGRSILVLYWLEAADRKAVTRQRSESGERLGVFALRSPHRPNPIGAAVVTIVEITRQCVRVRGMDCLDGTPLLDIKPVMPAEAAEGRIQKTAG